MRNQDADVVSKAEGNMDGKRYRELPDGPA